MPLGTTEKEQMIELMIKLDTDKVEAAVRDAWQREFRSPDGSRNNDTGGARLTQ